jgi:hypothetical protein
MICSAPRRSNGRRLLGHPLGSGAEGESPDAFKEFGARAADRTPQHEEYITAPTSAPRKQRITLPVLADRPSGRPARAGNARPTRSCHEYGTAASNGDVGPPRGTGSCTWWTSSGQAKTVDPDPYYSDH